MSIVKTYNEDAKDKLQKAQNIASYAHAALNETRLLISQSTNYSVKCEFALVALEQQLGIVDISLNSIKKWADKRQEELIEELDELSRVLDHLTKEMDVLRRLIVDKSLLSEERTGDTSLVNFVTSGLLEDLQLSHDTISRWANESEDGMNSSIKQLESNIKSLVDEFQQLEKFATSKSSNEENLVESYVEENNMLEKELAELLDALTDHYDQTLKGLDVLEGRLTISEEEQKELFDVLENDYEQVPEIISEIEQVSNDIIEKCSKIDESLSDMTLFSKCQTFLKKLIDFNQVQISPLFKLISSKESQIKAKIKMLSNDINDASNLTTDLNKFQSSYYSLILELDRRHIMQNRMVQIIEEARSKVEALQHDDFSFRNQFWSKNGDFLPKDLYNDEKESNPLCSISVKYNLIPKINDLTISNAKRFSEK